MLITRIEPIRSDHLKLPRISAVKPKKGGPIRNPTYPAVVTVAMESEGCMLDTWADDEATTGMITLNPNPATLSPRRDIITGRKC